ncbi:uncharacterized protein TM35_000151380 [Trypanosoma theileri]|uniref:PH domain-containing protein n=1 Tax=Trypanosoma theileri TaxID=67003 RepID=A0A1X0NVJ5_9TRYP|nr:uncharacterized protein TM35_000151380 [Trypanosoma theileri]ORC88707.1 hypothetical protein TM35_000151380 [Trypanosoma theileri]
MSNSSPPFRREVLDVESGTKSSDETNGISALLSAYAGRESELLQELKERINCNRKVKEGEQEWNSSNLADKDELFNSQQTGLDETSQKPLMIVDDQCSSEVNTPLLVSEMTPASIKRDVENSIGFASPLHRLRWEEAWFGTLPLSSFTRNWGDDVLHCGMGYKLTRVVGFVQRWAKRYFVLAWSLLYVFDGNKRMDRCRGAVYMYRADVQKTEVMGCPAIVITPATQKRPSELGKEKFVSFIMTVDADKMLDVWFTALRKISLVGVLSDSITIAAAAAGGNVSSPVSLSEQEPQPLLSLNSVNTVLVNPHNQESVTGVDVQIPNVGPITKENNEQFEQGEGIQLSSSSWQQPQPQQQQQQQQQQEEEEEVKEEVNSKNEFTLEKDKQTIIEDYRQHLQYITVSASDVKERLTRVAQKKEKKELGELLLKFIISHVDDAAGLWSLMNQVEDLNDRQSQNNSVLASTSQSSSSTSSSDISRLVREQQLILSNAPKKSLSVECRAKHNTPLGITTPTPSKKQHVFSPKEEEEESKQDTMEKRYDNNDSVGNISVFATTAGVEGGEVTMEDNLVRERRMRRLRERQQDIESILSELPSL